MYNSFCNYHVRINHKSMIGIRLTIQTFHFVRVTIMYCVLKKWLCDVKHTVLWQNIMILYKNIEYDKKMLLNKVTTMLTKNVLT